MDRRHGVRKDTRLAKHAHVISVPNLINIVSQATPASIVHDRRPLLRVGQNDPQDHDRCRRTHPARLPRSPSPWPRRIIHRAVTAPRGHLAGSAAPPRPSISRGDAAGPPHRCERLAGNQSFAPFTGQGRGPAQRASPGRPAQPQPADRPPTLLHLGPGIGVRVRAPEGATRVEHTGTVASNSHRPRRHVHRMGQIRPYDTILEGRSGERTQHTDHARHRGDPVHPPRSLSSHHRHHSTAHVVDCHAGWRGSTSSKTPRSGSRRSHRIEPLWRGGVVDQDVEPPNFRAPTRPSPPHLVPSPMSHRRHRLAARRPRSPPRALEPVPRLRCPLPSSSWRQLRTPLGRQYTSPRPRLRLRQSARDCLAAPSGFPQPVMSATRPSRFRPLPPVHFHARVGRGGGGHRRPVAPGPRSTGRYRWPGTGRPRRRPSNRPRSGAPTACGGARARFPGGFCYGRRPQCAQLDRVDPDPLFAQEISGATGQRLERRLGQAVHGAGTARRDRSNVDDRAGGRTTSMA